MTWEEKIKNISIDSEYLLECYSTLNFSLYYYSAGGSQDERGVNYLQRITEEGNLPAVQEIVPILQGQLDFLKRHLSLAKKYRKAGGEIEVRTTSYNLRVREGEKRYYFKNDFGLNSEGRYVLTFLEGYNLESIDKWILNTSRLLQHAEVRCLKHIRFKKTL